MQILGGQDNSTQAMQAFLSSLLPTLPDRRQGQQGGTAPVASPSGPAQVTIVGQSAPLQVVIVGTKQTRGSGGSNVPPEYLPQPRRYRTQAEQGAASAGQLYGQGSSFMKGMAQAADPFSTFATLEASITQLSIAVGRQFLPLINDVSQKIQETTKWFNGLDEGVKNSAAKVVFWVTVGAGIITVGAKIMATLNAIRLAMLGMLTGPMLPIAAITATAVALLHMSGAWDEIAKKAGLAGSAMKDAMPRVPRAENAINQKDIALLPEAVQKKLTAAGGNQGEVRKVLEQFQKDAAAELEKKKTQTIPNLARLQQRDEAVNKVLDDSGINRRIAGMRAVDKDAEERIKEQFENRSIPTMLGDWFRSALSQGQGGTPLERAFGRGTYRPEYHPEVEAEKQKQAAMANATRILPQAMDAAKKAGLDVTKEEMFNRILIGLRRDDERGFAGQGEGATDARRYEAERGGLKISNELKKLEDQKRIAGEMLNKSGGGLQEALRGLPQTRIMDPAAFSDAIQAAVLTGDDLDAQNKIDQLQALLDSKQLLTNIETRLIELKPQDRWRY